ncbi:hypothetical protein [Robertmurraya kyonggiensis]|uniref:Uncharacterized protein n=1 Tax=Robertmurraya kyonggiensis TaxID=1037680 RepID=A0A4U1DB67_9BACI|nr:hypothetical protein [Robertmurraya kyonggiensis]TKC19821.1 hypothetical protein FA727_09880 [Robertmurraya kyonggiensis]
MSFGSILIISLTTLAFYGMMEFITYLLLISNIERIRKRKKGLLFNYANMRLGDKFYHVK